MQFIQFYSSSTSNLYLVTAQSGKQLLLECGAGWKDIQKALHYDLMDVVGCCLTHEHKDHSRAIKEVLKAGINIFASSGTFDALGIDDARRAKHIRNKTIITFGTDFRVRAFTINHDAAEPLGFIVRNEDEYLLFVPDTSYITQRFSISFDIIAIECSYDKNTLQQRVDTGDINEEVAKRLLTSHMEKQTAIRYLTEFCNLSKCRQIHLLHMSGDNIDKKKTRAEFEKRFFIETRIVE